MSIESQIEAALFSHVATLEFDDDIPLAWPNVDFAPAGVYIRVEHLPNKNTRLFLKGNAPHLRQGILQLTVVAPLAAGASEVTALGGSIAEQCPADLALFGADVKVRVQKAPDVLPAEKTDVSWNARVDIYYDVFA